MSALEGEKTSIQSGFSSICLGSWPCLPLDSSTDVSSPPRDILSTLDPSFDYDNDGI